MNPLDQFQIHTIIELPKILGYNVNFTNSALYMLISVCIACAALWTGIARAQIVPGKAQSFIEIIYTFVTSLVESSCGKDGLRYNGFILTIFLFILSCNLAGMLPLPFSFTVTSHIIITLGIAFFAFCFTTTVGFKKQGLHFFSIFLPSGTPTWLAPMMIFLEFSTFIFRPVSLSIRLAANMVAGHTILKVIAGFAAIVTNSITTTSILISLASFVFVMILILFEVFVAILQAYIFAILTCVYLNDSLIEH